jgi:hypothetical protein
VALRPVRPEPHDHAFAMRPLWREPFVMLAPTGHPLLDKKEVDLLDFADQRVITIGNPLAKRRPIRDLHRYRDVGIWWHSERPLGAAAQAFIRTVFRTPRPEGATAIPPV